MLDLEIVQRQCLSLHESLAKMTAAEKKQRPSAHFGERFNQLLAQAKELLADPDASHWPPVIETSPAGAVGPKVSYATYVELRSYLREISDRLAQHIEPPMPTMG